MQTVTLHRFNFSCDLLDLWLLDAQAADAKKLQDAQAAEALADAEAVARVAALPAATVLVASCFADLERSMSATASLKLQRAAGQSAGGTHSPITVRGSPAPAVSPIRSSGLHAGASPGGNSVSRFNTPPSSGTPHYASSHGVRQDSPLGSGRARSRSRDRITYTVPSSIHKDRAHQISKNHQGRVGPSRSPSSDLTR